MILSRSSHPLHQVTSPTTGFTISLDPCVTTVHSSYVIHCCCCYYTILKLIWLPYKVMTIVELLKNKMCNHLKLFRVLKKQDINNQRISEGLFCYLVYFVTMKILPFGCFSGFYFLCEANQTNTRPFFLALWAHFVNILRFFLKSGIHCIIKWKATCQLLEA